MVFCTSNSRYITVYLKVIRGDLHTNAGGWRWHSQFTSLKYSKDAKLFNARGHFGSILFAEAFWNYKF